MASKIVSEDLSAPESPQPDTVVLTRAEWEGILDCSIAFHDALDCVEERGLGLEVLHSVEFQLSDRARRISNRLQGLRQSFEERSEDDDGISSADPNS